MESRMTEAIYSYLKNNLVPQFLEVRSVIRDVQKTFNKEVDLVVERKLQSTIDRKTIQIIKKHLGPKFMKIDSPKNVTYDNKCDASHSTNAVKVSDIDEDTDAGK